MLEANNNEEKKTIEKTEKCYCEKKMVVLEKTVKQLKVEVERQRTEIEIIKLALKNRG